MFLLTTIQLPGLYTKPKATWRHIFLCVFCWCFFYILDFYYTLIFFLVAYIDVFLLNMCSTSKYFFFTTTRFCLPVIFSRCFTVPFLTYPNALTTIGIIDVFNCHILSTSIWRSWYFESFSNSLAEIFISIGNEKSVSLHAFSLWSFIVTSGLFACFVLSVWIEKSHFTFHFYNFLWLMSICSNLFLAYGAL